MNVYLFDIDGTLVSGEGAGKAAMEAGLASAFGVKDGFADIRYSGRTARAIACDLYSIALVCKTITKSDSHRLVVFNY